MTLFLIGKDLVLGLTFKNRGHWGSISIVYRVMGTFQNVIFGTVVIIEITHFSVPKAGRVFWIFYMSPLQGEGG